MVNALVIVESPAKCKKIQGFLGPGYTVLATMGHIRALEEDLDAVGLTRDFEPKYRFLKEKSKATGPILDAAKKADVIYLAADDDREGEAIAYSVACLLKKDPLTLHRAVFHEITATAVKNAVANPRRLDMNRVNAQQARAVLDMMVGFTISPLLWKHVARALSAGRCQTPALRLVSDREAEIRKHTTETTWGLVGQFESRTTPLKFQATMEDELEDQESGLNYLENVHGNPGASVKGVVVKPWTLNAPKPLITSTLQQEASALYKLNPKATMKIAQNLYEAGHITYMRTDHAIMSEEAIASAQSEVKAKYGQAYVGDAASCRAAAGGAASASTTEKKKAKKGSESPMADQTKPQALPATQDAHECIRPTHFDLLELPSNEDWTATDKKVYSLIYRKAMQSTMAAARGQTRTVKLSLTADEDEFPWSASWKKTDFLGWQILGKQVNIDADEEESQDKGQGVKEDEEEKEEKAWKAAACLEPGTSLKWSILQAVPKRTRAPPRFTEATLIRELEKKGIGRPSTFASLVDTLFDKKYIEKQDISGTQISQTTLTVKPTQWPPLTQVKQVTQGAEKQKLVPSALGESVLSFCLKEFPQLFAYEFTALMENRLDKTARGEEGWKEVCQDTWNSYKADYERLSSKGSAPTNSEKVKDFGGGFKAVMTKNGPLLVQEAEDEKEKAKFYDFPVGETMSTITEEKARQWLSRSQVSLGTFKGKEIEKKKGPYGFYLQSGDLRIPFVDGESESQMMERFRQRAAAASTNYVFGPYTFSVGQYGPFMYKTDLKTKIFVSVPAETDVRKLTAQEVDALYKAGVEAKKAAGGRGGFGGRGRGGRGGRGGKGNRGGHA
jgi:DNA topoisomerase-1